MGRVFCDISILSNTQARREAHVAALREAWTAHVLPAESEVAGHVMRCAMG